MTTGRRWSIFGKRRPLFQPDPGAPRTEIVFVHIPKTAGTAFRQLLERVYQPAWETLFDDADGRELDRFQREVGRPPRVLTGHLPARALLPRAAGARSIVWLREPVRRLISQYFYWKGLPPQEDPRQRELRSGEASLVDYVDTYSNSYVDYWLRGYDLEDFDFVGIVERAQEDVAEMGRLFGWGDVVLEKTNQTFDDDYRSFSPDPALLKRILELNRGDLAVYERALRLREQRGMRAS